MFCVRGWPSSKALKHVTSASFSICSAISSRMADIQQKLQVNGKHVDDFPSGTKQCARRISNYDHFINAKSKRRTPSALREITKTFSEMPPQTISLAVGVPNLDTFPFQSFSVALKDGSSYKIEGKELAAALQYMPSTGYAPLIKQLRDLQDRTHGTQDWTQQSVLVTCGSSEPMANVFDMVLEPGDCVIIPIPLYTGPPDFMRPIGVEFIGLEQDKDGVQPQELRLVLEQRLQQKKTMPKIMYINPTACNPTGRNWSTERKKEIYSIACQYNFLILEDDPYYFLHFLDEEVPSLLSMDVEGRVLRMDSFSKIMSSGLRLGFVTGPRTLVRQIELHLHVTTLHPSALSQVMVSKLLDLWGQDSFDAHIRFVKTFYRERRDAMLAACDKYLTGLAEWDVSLGGMFLWVKVIGLEDSWALATKHCLDRFLLVLPGHPFTGDLTPPHYNYLRLSFSLATPTQMDKGIKILAEVIKEVKSSAS